MKTFVLLSLFFGFFSFAQIDSTKINDLFPLADKDEIFGLSRNPKNPYQLNQDYFFNKKIHFQLKWQSYVSTSYFYLNTKTGYSLLDKNFFNSIRDRNTFDYHLTFPEFQEYFVYFTDPRKNDKYSRISHSSLPIGPQSLENPEELLRYFKDWFSGPQQEIQFLGDKHDLKSEQYIAMFNGEDLSIFLSKKTDAEIVMKYCVGWLGLGFINRNNDETEIITRLFSASAQYQIDLLYIENVNYTFSGKPYQSVQSKINLELDKAEESFLKDKNSTERRISTINDAIDAELERKLQAAKDKKMSKAKTIGKKLAEDHGKAKDLYAMMAEANDPLDDMDIFDAEINLKIYKISKKIDKERKADKKQQLISEKMKLQESKQKIEAYRKKFENIRSRYQNNKTKLGEENSKIFTEMLNDFKL